MPRKAARKRSPVKPVRRAPRKRAAPTRAAGAAQGPLPEGIDPLVLNAMSLRVQSRGTAGKRLTGPEIERALISGAHAQTLEMYFGEAEYAQLRRLAPRATRRAARAGPRVLILPGIIGSMLARVQNPARPDTIWLDFIDIALGRLKYLALPDAGPIGAIDVHHATYLGLKLWLQDQGFNADFHPFDWRLGLPELGRELAARVRDDPASEVLIVAHSMGGLVARAALQHGMDKLKRLVMLGTPNFGSFAPAMVIRGVYPFLNKIAQLDLAHTSEWLAANVFNTHPGLIQMLPQRSKFSAVDLYDSRKWPTSGARPQPDLLAAAIIAQQKLAIDPGKFVMIAGVDRETTVGLRVANDEFVFERSRAGDGTVPVDLAVLPDVRTYYVAEEHGSLPRNTLVHKAVVDILRDPDGATSKLPDAWAATRANAHTEVTESALRERFEAQATRGASPMSAADLRNIMAELAAPAIPGALGAEVSAATATASPVSAGFEELVIGRRRQRRIDVRLARGSLTQVKSRAYVLGLFENVAPAGAAAAIDALMDGTIGEFRRRRMFSSAVGEVFVVPAGRNDVCADYVVLAGLGHFDTFNLQVLEIVAESIARTLARLDIEEFATVPIGAGSGLDFDPSMEALLRGFFRGLDDADRDQSFRSVTFCEIDEARYELLKWALYRLSSTALCGQVEVTLSELHLPPPPAPGRDAPAALPPVIYLTVRTLRTGPALTIETSLLTTGAKAAVLGGEVKVPEAQLRAHLELIENDQFTYARLPAFGATLAQMVLDPAIMAGLEGCAGNHVVVVHDADASRIPWETLCLDGRFPALEGGMSRRYLAPNLSVAKWLERRREDESLDVLMVVNPTQDLNGATEEGQRVQALFSGIEGVRLKQVIGAQATRSRVRAEFASGNYDILHYAGHAFFDPLNVSRSGILCADGPLTGAELAEIGNLPSLVVFNACESARVRRLVRRESPNVTKNMKERIERSVGLAEAFLRGGVANYVGTYWPVGDEAAKGFAENFYKALLEGETLAEATRRGRAAVNAIASQDWADYIVYGSVDFRVKAVMGNEGRNE